MGQSPIRPLPVSIRLTSSRMRVSDTLGERRVAIVSVTVDPINDPPVANDDIVYLDMNTSCQTECAAQ